MTPDRWDAAKIAKEIVEPHRRWYKEENGCEDLYEEIQNALVEIARRAYVEGLELGEKIAKQYEQLEASRASLADVLNQELRENSAGVQVEVDDDFRPAIRLLVDATRRATEFALRPIVKVTTNHTKVS